MSWPNWGRSPRRRLGALIQVLNDDPANTARFKAATALGAIGPAAEAAASPEVRLKVQEQQEGDAIEDDVDHHVAEQDGDQQLLGPAAQRRDEPVRAGGAALALQFVGLKAEERRLRAAEEGGEAERHRQDGDAQR